MTVLSLLWQLRVEGQVEVARVKEIVTQLITNGVLHRPMLADQKSALLTNQNGRSVEVGVRDFSKHRGVRHPQPTRLEHSVNKTIAISILLEISTGRFILPELGVDDCEGISPPPPHAEGGRGVVEGQGQVPDIALIVSVTFQGESLTTGKGIGHQLGPQFPVRLSLFEHCHNKLHSYRQKRRK